VYIVGRAGASKFARPAGEVFRRLHEEHGILVRDVGGAPELAGCLRISIGTEEDMDAVLAALEEIFSLPPGAR